MLEANMKTRLVLLVFYAVLSYTLDSTSSFPQTTLSLNSSEKVYSVDRYVDRDGRTAILLSTNFNRYYIKLNGSVPLNGSISDFTQDTITLGNPAILLDINEDDNVDIAVYDGSMGILTIFLGPISPTATPILSTMFVPYLQVNVPIIGDLQRARINNDSKDDIVFNTVGSNQSLCVFYGRDDLINVTINFNSSYGFCFVNFLQSISQVKVGHFTSKSSVDFVIKIGNTDTLFIAARSWNFYGNVNYNSYVNDTFGGSEQVLLADVTGDSYDDLILISATRTAIYFYVSLQNTTIPANYSYAITGIDQTTFIASSDVNGDLLSDFVFNSYMSTNSMYCLYGPLSRSYTLSSLTLEMGITGDYPGALNYLGSTKVNNDTLGDILLGINSNLQVVYGISTLSPTAAPTTLAPTTVSPTTRPPTTLAPTTRAPTTLAPTTRAPTTVAPTTLAPTTVAPTTLAPTTVAPTTLAPTTESHTTLTPTTLTPTTLTPTTLAPTIAPTTPYKNETRISESQLVIGDLALLNNQVLYFGSNGFVNVTGCLDLNGVNIHLENISESALESGSQVLFAYSCINSTNFTITIDSSSSDCKTAEVETQEISDGQLVVIFNVKDNCDSLPVGVIVAVVVVVTVVIIALIIVFAVPSIREKVLPYQVNE
eukprot:TRINITY_DN1248_c0_g1_i6.p1 TRINITY_DN1248_c0_g1~~TRINITY_DN1248_c0_g1_i6.p1  ORF type:complete len:654 (+),score=90.94 TRINITY_DN1248_c0_g1_i6:71-2032(+)